jgi:DNA processing protein
MPLDARVDAWARLALAPVRPAVLASLLRTFGSAEGVFAASRPELVAASSSEVAAAVHKVPDESVLEQTRRWLEGPDHELLAWDDPDYPKALLEIGDAPPVLFFIGVRELLNRPALAIVGSRNATPQGVENARNFASALSEAGLTIVSGLALGIDGAAHEGGLADRGSTIACVATGLDRVYPGQHRDLAHAIAERGALLSELVPGTPPLRSNFPRRNRLISGLSKGVLVVEATLSSGSLITAKLAGEQSREVFAIPGSIHSPFSRGCHKLIREGAKLVETAQDILDELRIPELAHIPEQPKERPDAGPHAVLMAALGEDPSAFDQLVARTRLAPEALAAALVELELDGLVAALPGARWQRVG